MREMDEFRLEKMSTQEFMRTGVLDGVSPNLCDNLAALINKLIDYSTSSAFSKVMRNMHYEEWWKEHCQGGDENLNQYASDESVMTTVMVATAIELSEEKKSVPSYEEFISMWESVDLGTYMTDSFNHPCGFGTFLDEIVKIILGLNKVEK